MLKQKIDTAALFAQKKTEVQRSARTLLTVSYTHLTLPTNREV